MWEKRPWSAGLEAYSHARYICPDFGTWWSWPFRYQVVYRARRVFKSTLMNCWHCRVFTQPEYLTVELCLPYQHDAGRFTHLSTLPRSLTFSGVASLLFSLCSAL
jgi:hypothetical protein